MLSWKVAGIYLSVASILYSTKVHFCVLWYWSASSSQSLSKQSTWNFKCRWYLWVHCWHYLHWLLEGHTTSTTIIQTVWTRVHTGDVSWSLQNCSEFQRPILHSMMATLWEICQRGEWLALWSIPMQNFGSVSTWMVLIETDKKAGHCWAGHAQAFTQSFVFVICFALWLV